MVQVNEIVDQDSLQQWLRELPFDEDENRRIAVTIAHRAAMRVLPVYWSSSVDDHDLLEVLRMNLLTGIAAKRRIPNIRTAINKVQGKANTSVAELNTVDNFGSDMVDEITPPPVTDFFLTDPEELTLCAYNAAFLPKGSIEAAVEASGVMLSELEIQYIEIQAEVEALFANDWQLDRTSLWHILNPLAEEWQALRHALPESWSFWRDWYQDALDGIPPDWDMLSEIALIDREEWDKGPEHVNPLIDRIVERHRLRKEVRALREELTKLRVKTATPAWRGDNNPPELIEVASEAQATRAVEIIWANLGEAEKELEEPAPDPGVLQLAGRWIVAAAKALGKYVASLGDAYLKGAVGAAGVATIAYASTHWPQIVSLGQRLIEFADKLMP